MTAWNNFLDCVTQLVYAINVPIGDSFSYTLKAVEALANTILNLLVNLPTFQSYLKHNFAPQMAQVWQYLRSASVGYGNFWRQFDTTGLCPFPSINPPGKVPNPFPDTNFFCCFGGVTTSIVRYLIDVADSFLSMLVSLISDSQNIPNIANTLLFDLQNNIIPDYNSLVTTGSCALASPFVMICTDSFIPAPLVIGNLASSLINITSIPLYMFEATLEVVLGLVEGKPIQTVTCELAVAAYDMTFGNFFNIINNVGQIAGFCFFFPPSSSHL